MVTAADVTSKVRDGIVRSLETGEGGHRFTRERRVMAGTGIGKMAGIRVPAADTW